LIGPNGAGKTTLFNCLNRLYQPARAIFHWRREHFWAARRTGSRKSASPTFQKASRVPILSVLGQRSGVGTHFPHQQRPLSASSLRTGLGPPRRRPKLKRARHEIVRLLDLDDVAHVTVSGLPFGTQKRRGAARALAAEPKDLCCSTKPPAPQPRRGPRARRILKVAGSRRRHVTNPGWSNITMAW